VKIHLQIGLLLGAALVFTGCGNDSIPEGGKSNAGTRKIPNLNEGDFWDGFESEFKKKFHTDDDQRLVRTTDALAFTGEITKRSDAGALASKAGYLAGHLDGNSFTWYESGPLKSKIHYKAGLKEGLEIIWTEDGHEYSRKHYVDGVEDLSRAGGGDDEKDIPFGQSPEALALAKWTGTGGEFGEKFAGDPGRNGTVYIRKIEGLYTGTITALDDAKRKEAELNFKDGRWHGMITKWDLEGNIWEKAEFENGELIRFHIQSGKPFDPNQIINASPFGQ